MIDREMWVPVKGHERQYEVSTYGRIRSLLSSRGNPWKNGPQAVMPRQNGRGYMRVTIKGKDEYIHRLVLRSFVGECPEHMECAHLDGKPHNNALSNLAWVTRQENSDHKFLHGTAPKGECHGRAKLDRNQIKAIKNLLQKGMPQREIGGLFQVTQSAISLIKRGKNWGSL
jgi:hypothetical protein